ncbi:hypothetical protein CAPTEDRAFT_190517 [Capitella teleta]|uniref:Gustatory receptor n=1 Tax=Capitella teleta TaxID=283909 RepID=R7THP8_CAPTE|nr:hypothetical protein CAPTEDRAFT_190517 [Capitella teleta]|eukprot:ELT92997.1 hypothetical protein CAPTEDRAFT_190517 [Capitella teleta]
MKKQVHAIEVIHVKETEDSHEEPDPLALSTNELFKSMHCLVTSLHIFGAIHINEDPGTKWTASKVHLVAVFLLLVLNQIRMGFNFVNAKINPEFFWDVMFYSWMLLAVTNSFNMYKVCICERRLVTVFTSWKEFNPRPSKTKTAHFKKKSRIYITTGWCYLLTSIISSLYAQFATSFLDANLVPFSIDSSYIDVIRVISVLLNILISGSWIFVNVLIFFLADVAHYELREFNREFRKRLTNDGEFHGELEEYRQRHQSICRFINDIDASIHLSVGFSFVVCMVGILLSIYNVIWWQRVREDSFMAVMITSWIMNSAITLFCIIIFGAYVNNEAHALANDAYNISLLNTTDTFRLQVSTFLSRLTGPPIGLTAASMFVIDKPTLLTMFFLKIVGVLVSYFVLIVQFSPSYSGGQTPSNMSHTAINHSLNVE